MYQISYYLLLLVLPTLHGSITQNEETQIEFYDDPAFENLEKKEFRGTPAPVTMDNLTVFECADQCRQSHDCVNFFYNSNSRVCQLVPLLLVVNGQNSRDRSIVPQVPRQFFRYVPAHCPMEKCFYYDAKTKMCLRAFLGDGPERDHRFRQRDTQRCRRAGGLPVSMDTYEKFQQVELMLKNIPEVAPKDSSWWRWFWAGAVKRGGVFVWPNNKTVDTSRPNMWSRSISEEMMSPRDNCLALVHWAPRMRGTATEYRLTTIPCEGTLYGYLCEIPHPTQG